MTRVARLLILFLVFGSLLSAQQRAPEEDKIWSLEQAYWSYVQANDLEAYRALWHADFLGWPMSSPEPARKDHITDWIMAHNNRGETLKSYELERLAVRVRENIATSAYRVRSTWVDKNGAGQPSTQRILHTWIRSADGKWEIISGMSAPSGAEGR